MKRCFSVSIGIMTLIDTFNQVQLVQNISLIRSDNQNALKSSTNECKSTRYENGRKCVGRVNEDG